MGFRWVLLKLFSQVLHNTRYNYIFNNIFSAERWMSDLFVSNIICFQTPKQLTTLNNIWVLLKHVFIDLRACNFVHPKTSSHARCMHTHQLVYNLSSPDFWLILINFWIISSSSDFLLQLYQVILMLDLNHGGQKMLNLMKTHILSL